MKKVPLLCLLSIFFLSVDAQTWIEKLKIVASDREANDRFGYSTAISGDYAISGAWKNANDASGGNPVMEAGAAYIFMKDGAGNWSEIQKIVASDRASEDWFGAAVSISGDYAIVGAGNQDLDASGGSMIDDAGAAYIFKKDGNGNWNQVQKLVSSNRGVDFYFGDAVSIDGDYAVVGSSFEDGSGLMDTGAIYVFEKDGNDIWNQVQRLVSSDLEKGDQFGYAVSIDGNQLIAGAIFEEASGGKFGAGAAYIFERGGNGTWTQQKKLVVPAREQLDFFGWSVDLEGNNALIGAVYEDEDASGGSFLEDAGAAYLFEKDGSGNWAQKQVLVPSDREEDDWFGVSVGLSGNYAVVGSWLDDDDVMGGNSKTDAGSAYIFEKGVNGNWSQMEKIVASDRGIDDIFGTAVAIENNYIMVGANNEDDDASGNNPLADAGSLYFFEAPINLGFSQNDFGPYLKAFPNPTDGKMTIDLGQAYRDIHIEVRNVMGQMIYSRKVDTSDKIEMEIKGSAGLYFVEIQSLEGKSAMLKVVKE